MLSLDRQRGKMNKPRELAKSPIILFKKNVLILSTHRESWNFCGRVIWLFGKAMRWGPPLIACTFRCEAKVVPRARILHSASVCSGSVSE